MTEMVYGTVHARADDPVLPRWWRTVDRWVLFSVLILFGIGILLGLAASPPLAEKNGFDSFYYVQKQASFGAIAFVALLICSMMPLKMIRRLGVISFFVAFTALALLPFFGTGFGKGAIRWYSLGFASIQPSEFLKPAFVVLMAWLISASHQVAAPPGKFYSFVVTILVCALLVMQPDFGQSLLFLFAWGAMYFVGGASIILLVGVASSVLFAGMFAYSNSEHFARRIDGFLNPEIDPRTQLGYAANAIQEGGLFGVGVGEGSVKWSLPDAHTDFIIAVAAEEYGLILVFFIIFLYMAITVRSLLRLMRERDMFARLAGTGMVCLFGLQAFINMGVAVRLLPAKGMTLPFVSYGGSSLVASGILVGCLLALTRTRPQGEYEDILQDTRRHHG